MKERNVEVCIKLNRFERGDTVVVDRMLACTCDQWGSKVAVNDIDSNERWLTFVDKQFALRFCEKLNAALADPSVSVIDVFVAHCVLL